ncbi:MAG: DegT/DnrJ/EryC1/StrS family aminotransferase [Phycisphaerae bacterium]
MRRVAMLDLQAEYKLFRDEIRGAVDAVLETQQFINGPAVAELEGLLASRVGVANAVGVSSGTDALLCSLMGLGIGSGDEVIVPAFTFFATAGAVVRVGATPVFVDIDARTFNLDPACVEAAITKRTRAIIAVHLFGQCADMRAIQQIATKHSLAIVEDAAQALGATYQGRRIGAWGDVACLSFYPTKNLGGFGEGGMILLNDTDLADVLRRLRNHGESTRYLHERVGGNFRLDTMKAAILIVKLKKLDEFTRRRRYNAARYDELLDSSSVAVPYVPDQHHPVYHQYSILCDRRDELKACLADHGVACSVYYPVPLHLQPCFSYLGYARGSLPVSERTCKRILSLPCHPMLSDEDLEHVASCVNAFHGSEATDATSDTNRTLENAANA